MFQYLFMMLYPYVPQSDRILSIIEELTAYIENEKAVAVSEATASHRDSVDKANGRTHVALVALALSDEQVLTCLAETRKINAIKRLKFLIGSADSSRIGLKAYKDAVEDDRVTRRVNYLAAGNAALNNLAAGTPDCEQ